MCLQVWSQPLAAAAYAAAMADKNLVSMIRPQRIASLPLEGCCTPCTPTLPHVRGSQSPSGSPASVFRATPTASL